MFTLHNLTPPRVVLDLPAPMYHATQAMSAGGLKRMAQSPAHFFGAQLDPERPPPSDPTPAMAAGTLFHCALFEPDQVAQRYVVRPDDIDARTKVGKAWIAEQSSIVIDAQQLRVAHRQAAAVRALPEIGPLLSSGIGEASAFWLDPETGELCKCRPDWVTPAGHDGVILIDGKTGIDVSPGGFPRAVANFGYHHAAAWYTDGYQAASGREVLAYVFACTESAYPHAAAAYMLSEDDIERARVHNRAMLNLYAECKRTGVWPGYPPQVQLIELPRWAR